MDIQKIVDFLEQYPNWFKIGVVISLALIAVGLLTLRQSKPVTNSVAAAPRSAPHSVTATTENTLVSSTAKHSLSNFHQNRRALEGRFLELQESLKQMQGATVTWEGYVARVSDSGTQSHPILVIVAESEATNPDLAAVALPEVLRAKAYSLQKGDLIRFVGVIYSPSDTPALEAEKIEVLRPRGGG